MRVRSLAMMVGSVATLAMLVLAASYAWFVHTAFEGADGNMGEVKVGFGGHVEVGEDGIVSFEVLNDSTIDIYMRLGWTPIYRDEAGKEIAMDVSGIEVIDAWPAEAYDDNFQLDVMKPVAGEITSQNSYVKNMITLEEQNGEYFVVPAGVDVKGYIKLNVANSPESTERLYVVFVTEALQATRKAVAEAASYGWDEAKVGKQARWIVAMERGEGQ